MTYLFSRRCRWTLALLTGLLTLLVGLPPALAGTVTLSSTPPGVTSKVAPNIVVTFDDSGSMNSTSVPDAMDGNYTKKYYYSATGNPIYFDPNVTYIVPPDATGAALGTPSYTSAWRDGYCANTLTKQCWTPTSSSRGSPSYKAPILVDLSSSFYSGFLVNISAGNSPCPRNFNELGGWYTNSNNCSSLDIPDAIRSTTTTTSTSTSTSTSTVTCVTGFALFYSSCPSAGTSGSGSSSTTTTCAATGNRDPIGNTIYRCTSTTTTTTTTTITSKYNGGLYYVCPTANSETGCVLHQVNSESADIQQNFAIWYSYYRTRTMTARAAIGRVFGSLADNSVRVAWQTLQDQTDSSRYQAYSPYTGLAYSTLSSSSKILELVNATTGCSALSKDDSCWRSQFMNWVYGVPASGGTPSRVATQTAGEFYKRTLDSKNPGLDPYWNGSTSAPKELACRKNFNMLVTDGYWNNDSPTTPAILETKGTTLPDGKSYSVSDAYSKVYWNDASNPLNSSLSNIAFNYWATDLRTDLDNKVPAYYPDLSTGAVNGTTTTVDATSPGSNPEVYFNPANDPATWQHMSQYMVTMGVPGTLANTSAMYLSLRQGGTQWPTPTTGGGDSNVDDTWHAALNSRGGYFSAADPTALVSAISSILSSVIASSSSSLNFSLSSQVLNTGAIAFSAGYNTTDYSGSLVASSLKSDGTLDQTLWSAAALLTATTSTNRVIVTSSDVGAGKGVPFRYASLSSTEQAALNSADGLGTTSDNLGSDRVDWLRGVRTKEGSTFRTRTSLLGAIFSSQPLYVAAPSGGYSDTFPAGSPEANALAASSTASYSNFVSTNASRAAMVYVGANDGMLHAFDARLSSVSGATPGKELWAYVPASVYANLPLQSRLTNFSFTPTVDGSPISGDVFFGSDYATNNSVQGWHTILVGSLRYGGRGIFALDITTTPSGTFSESIAAQKVLWEFNNNSTGGANLGYTFGTPSIARLANGKWAVLLPGGYFPDGSSGSQSYSSLFVIDAQTGALIKEIRTPSSITSYGLTTPTLGDYQGDQVADVAFAGDILGNLWRFDLSAANLSSATVDAGVSLLFKPATATAQSITTAPRLVADPTSNYFIVVFGTGRYLSTSDTPDTTVQSLYGVRDPGGNVATPVVLANLTAQAMTVDTATGGIGVTSNNVPATSKGWYLPLNSTTTSGTVSSASGERVVVTPSLVAGTSSVVFSTLIPSSSDPCTTANSGSVIALNATNGNPAAGTSIGTTATFGSGYSLAGGRVTGAATSGSLYAAAGLSGGTLYLPGNISVSGSKPVSLGIPTSRRRSWRILNNEN